MKTTEKKAPKSHVKIVIYFKRDKAGREYTQEEISKCYNRKEEYKYDYFPKAGGGWITNHEKAFDNADKHLRDVINTDNIYKGMILLCKDNGEEERVVNYVHSKGWEFYNRPQFVTTDKGHRYISKYQTLQFVQR